MRKFQTIDNKNGKSIVLEDSLFEALSQQIRGDIVFKGEEEYENARTIWNNMIEKSPTAIIRCMGTADVVAAVNFAREHNLLISVRGGGHNVAGHALCEGGIMIDLSNMKGIHVNPRSKTALVQPGVNLGDLDKETQLFDLAAPTGIVSKTGLAGLTLGGGFGWLTRKYGFTSDNLLSAEVVTADGQVLRASDEQNPDLFWGIRGGGGNFGVVTLFEYDLHSVGPMVLGGLLLHPMEKAGELLRFYRDFAKDAPEELGSLFAMRLAPPAPFLPEDIHGKPIWGIIVVYAGDLEEGERVLEPLRNFGQPLADKIGPKPYIGVQSMLDQGQPEGNQYYVKSHYMTKLPDKAIDRIVAQGKTLPSPLTRILIMQLGGAIRRLDEMASAVSHRDAEFVLAINNGWRDPSESSKQVEWTRDLWKDIKPYSSGHYVNFLPADENQEGVWTAYGKEKYNQLVNIKNKYDPDNFFRLNQNIKPSI